MSTGRYTNMDRGPFAPKQFNPSDPIPKPTGNREIEASKPFKQAITAIEEFKDAVETTLPTTKEKTVAAPKRGRPTNEEAAMKKGVMDIFLAGMDVTITRALEEKTYHAAEKLREELHLIKDEIKEYKRFTIVTEHKETVLQERTHQNFKDLLRATQTGFPVMLVGGAGSGKTYGAEQVAKAVSLDFYAMSVGSQTSKIDLLGYMNQNGDYIGTAFRRAYENGGVFLMDEIDAGNPNVLIVLNSALSNDMCAFADKMVKRHKSFVFISTANTYGTGADRQYVGRNQLDSATLDRFITINWNVDENLERDMVADHQHGPRWCGVVQKVRKYCHDHSYRLIVSPRATLKGTLLLDQGFDPIEVIEMSLLATATTDQASHIRDLAYKTWDEASTSS